MKNKIKALNKKVDPTNTDLEALITELMERNEFSCTGFACAGDAMLW
jgi:hypothetical protein